MGDTPEYEGTASDCWRCIHCEAFFLTRAARNRHEDTVCEPVDVVDDEDVFKGFHEGDE